MKFKIPFFETQNQSAPKPRGLQNQVPNKKTPNKISQNVPIKQFWNQTSSKKQTFERKNKLTTFSFFNRKKKHHPSHPDPLVGCRSKGLTSSGLVVPFKTNQNHLNVLVQLAQLQETVPGPEEVVERRIAIEGRVSCATDDIAACGLSEIS